MRGPDVRGVHAPAPQRHLLRPPPRRNRLRLYSGHTASALASAALGSVYAFLQYDALDVLFPQRSDRILLGAAVAFITLGMSFTALRMRRVHDVHLLVYRYGWGDGNLTTTTTAARDKDRGPECLTLPNFDRANSFQLQDRNKSPSS